MIKIIRYIFILSIFAFPGFAFAIADNITLFEYEQYCKYYKALSFLKKQADSTLGPDPYSLPITSQADILAMQPRVAERKAWIDPKITDLQYEFLESKGIPHWKVMGTRCDLPFQSGSK